MQSADRRTDLRERNALEGRAKDEEAHPRHVGLLLARDARRERMPHEALELVLADLREPPGVDLARLRKRASSNAGLSGGRARALRWWCGPRGAYAAVGEPLADDRGERGAVHVGEARGLVDGEAVEAAERLLRKRGIAQPCINYAMQDAKI